MTNLVFVLIQVRDFFETPNEVFSHCLHKYEIYVLNVFYSLCLAAVSDMICIYIVFTFKSIVHVHD